MKNLVNFAILIMVIGAVLNVNVFSQNGRDNALHIYGGQGDVMKGSTITPEIGLNDYSIGTGGQSGIFAALYDIPTNPILADKSAVKLVYVVRYKDEDGRGNSAGIKLTLITNDVFNGTRSTTEIFNSNNYSSQGTVTLIVCRSLTTLEHFDKIFNFDRYGTHLFATVTGSVNVNATLYQVMMYKGQTCSG